MELQRNRLSGVDAGVEAGSDLWIVRGIGSRLRLGNLKEYLRRESGKLLVRPDWSRWTSFDGPGQAGLSIHQERIQELLGGIGFRCRSRSQRRYRLEDIKARHRRAERLHSKQRAGAHAGRYVVAAGCAICQSLRMGAGNKRTQTSNGREQAGAGKQAPLDQFAARNLAGGIGFHYLSPIIARVLRIPEASFGGVLGQEETIISLLHFALLVELQVEGHSRYRGQGFAWSAL